MPTVVEMVSVCLASVNVILVGTDLTVIFQVFSTN